MIGARCLQPVLFAAVARGSRVALTTICFPTRITSLAVMFSWQAMTYALYNPFHVALIFPDRTKVIDLTLPLSISNTIMASCSCFSSS